MGISDKIETFINQLLKDETDNEWIDLGRNELAGIFGCVPSQINYVISTRFNTEHGYIVESRRGGGGYLRIKKINTSDENAVFTAIQSINDSIDQQTAKLLITNLRNADFVKEDVALLMSSAVSDKSITVKQPEKDQIRANILKNMLAVLGSSEA